MLLHFEEYQKARVKFVQAIAEAATRPQNIEVMNNAGVMQLLRPLLLDNVPSIQQTAALALGRLANYSEDLAEAVVGNEILPQLVYSLSDQNVSDPCLLFQKEIVSVILYLLFFLTYPLSSPIDLASTDRSDFIKRQQHSYYEPWPSTHLNWHRPWLIPVRWRH